MENKAIEYTKNLITIPSVSGDEKACLQFVYEWMIAANLSDVIITDDFVAGYKKGKSSKKALILAGHVDTVSAGNVDGWDVDPWQPHIEGDKLYGLGGSDMKGGVAAQMAALEASTNIPDDVWLVVAANEEIDGAGSAAFADYFADKYTYEEMSCVIAEPTGLEHIEVGHRGNAFVLLTFLGKTGHGSQQKHYHESALPLAATFLGDVDTLAAKLAKSYSHELMGTPTVVPTSISAGDTQSPNKTAASAKIMLDIRTTPSSAIALEGWLDEVCATYGCTWSYAAKPVQPCLCELTAPIIEKVKNLSGITSVGVTRGATDQTFFESIGVSTVVFGPGEFGQAHVQNEWVSCQKIGLAAQLYHDLIHSV